MVSLGMYSAAAVVLFHVFLQQAVEARIVLLVSMLLRCGIELAVPLTCILLWLTFHALLFQNAPDNFTCEDVPANFGPRIPDQGVKGLLVVGTRPSYPGLPRLSEALVYSVRLLFYVTCGLSDAGSHPRGRLYGFGERSSQEGLDCSDSKNKA
jgi:hypothetical protein